MAVGYQYRLTQNFPELTEHGKTEELTPQQILIGDEYRPATSSITFDRVVSFRQYKKYLVIHETERKIRVRFYGDILNSVIEHMNFELYLAADGSHVLVKTKDTHCDELLRRISETYPSFSYSRREIDLVRMQTEDAPMISGGWFRELQQADLSAAALFGEEVTESIEWERYVAQGQISFLNLTYIDDDASYRVGINKYGGVVIYPSLAEKVQLQLVDIISRRIEPYVIQSEG